MFLIECNVLDGSDNMSSRLHHVEEDVDMPKSGA